MKRFLTILSVSVMGLSLSSRGQDIHFSQFYENSILRNPALTGIFSEDYKVGLDYRSQWSSIANAYNTVAISAETRILINREVGDYLSFGLAATYDKAGTINFTSEQVYPAICYNKSLDDKHYTYLSVGLTGGFITSSVDMSKMTFSSQYIGGAFNANNPTGESATFRSTSNYDIGAGVSLNGSLDYYNKLNYYLGVSAFNINAPSAAFSGTDGLVKTPMEFQFNAGIHCVLTDEFGLTIHANFAEQQPYTETIVGGLITWRPIAPAIPSIFAFSVGAFYRYQDAIIPTVKIEYENIAFGFSYDVTTSSLTTGPGSGAGASEITLYVKGKYNKKRDPLDPLKSPRFDYDANPFH